VIEMSQDPAPPNLAQLLAVPFQAIVAELHARLAAAGYGDIRPHHGPVFGYLPAEGARLSELAERAQTTKQLMAYLVDALEERGYVERVPDPTDRRAKLVRFTTRGRAAARAGGAIIHGIEAEWGRRIGEQHMRDLRSLLGHLAGVIAPPRAP